MEINVQVNDSVPIAWRGTARANQVENVGIDPGPERPVSEGTVLVMLDYVRAGKVTSFIVSSKVEPFTFGKVS